jgi:hypothetical protein
VDGAGCCAYAIEKTTALVAARNPATADIARVGLSDADLSIMFVSSAKERID